MSENLVDFVVLDNEEGEEIEEYNDIVDMNNNRGEDDSFSSKERQNMINSKNDEEASSYHLENSKLNNNKYLPNKINENFGNDSHKDIEFNFDSNDENSDRNKYINNHSGNYINKTEKKVLNFSGDFNLEENAKDKENLIIDSNHISHRVDDDCSKTSFANLSKDLEDKWETIEKGKKNRTGKLSNNQFELGSRMNKQITQNKNRDNMLNKKKNFDSKFKKELDSNLDILDRNKRLIHAYKLKSIKYKEDNEFEIFVQSKFLELEKIKQKKTISELETINNQNDEGVHPYESNSKKLNSQLKIKIQNGFRNYNETNSPYQRSDSNSIVYQSNLGKKNINPLHDNYNQYGINSYNCKPSFLKSNLDMNIEKNNLSISRGNTFNYINNSKSIEDLVYERDQDKTNRTEINALNPSKNLISKMQNIFGIITQSNGTVDTKNDTAISVSHNKNNDDGNIDTQSNLNNLDKTYTINNLDKNFENIFTRVSPNYRNIEKIFRVHHFKMHEKNENLSEFNNDPIIQKKLRNLMNKSNNSNKYMSTPTSSHDKIKQKIGENHCLLKNLFNNLNNKPKEHPVTLNLSRNHVKNLSSLNHSGREKVYSKNNFSELMNKVSRVNSVKVKKILNLNE